MAGSPPDGKPLGSPVGAGAPDVAQVTLESTVEGTLVIAPPAPVSAPPSGDPQGLRPLEQGVRVERYVILKPVGEGGMGVVYAAYDPELDRKVALKLLRPAQEEADKSEGR